MKKVLSLLVALSMLLSILPAMVSAAHWADEDVKYLIENGAIAEDDTMLQNLDTPITRSQMVKVIVALLEGEEPEEGKEYFTDITAEDTHIAKAAENGFVNGFGDGTFRPNNPITRQDFFTIVGRAYKLEGEATNEFTDADSIADYAKPYVDALQSIGIVNGYGDGTVNPRGNITIAETLAVMHRTDAHVKANTSEETPKEEEKKTTGSSGGGGGGGGGGFSSSSQPSWSRKEADELMPSFTYEIEYAEDYSSGVVAYITPSIPDQFASMPKVLVRGTKDTYYNMTGVGGYVSSMDAVTTCDLDIPENNGTYAVPDFGTYSLCLYDSIIRDWRKFEVTVVPPKSEDITPPTLTVEVSGENNIPFEIKVSASDDVELVRLNYVRVDSVTSTYEEKACLYKAHPNDRKDITDGSFIAKATDYAVCAMDASGNCSYAEFKVRYGQPIVVTYSSETIDEVSDKIDTSVSGDTSDKATFAIEREKDLSGQYVARVRADIDLSDGTIKKKLLLKDGDYIGEGTGSSLASWEVAEELGQYIVEEDGVFRIPDFDKYALYILDDKDTWYEANFEVKPPESDDTTPPVLTIKAPQEAYLPTTVQIEAEDDAGIARISYVIPSAMHIVRDRKIYDKFNMYVNGREIITDNSLPVGICQYAICAMDVNGNCSYAFVSAGGSSNVSPGADLIYVEYGDEETRPDRTAPMIDFYRYDSNLTLKAYFEDNKEVIEAGWFYMSEPYEMDSDEKQIKRAYILDGQTIDLSKNIEDLTEFDDEHGGLGSVCILKNYYDATQEINGVKITPISGKPWVPIIKVQQNGAYFIYAKDSAGNLSVIRIDINNINTEPAPDSTEP